MEKEGFSNLTYTGYVEEKGSRKNREYPILGVWLNGWENKDYKDKDGWLRSKSYFEKKR